MQPRGRNLISPAEYRDRQRKLRDAARERGLIGVLTLGRGGGSLDRVGQALWLGDAASPQPFVPDLDRHWRAAGHVALVVLVDGPATAIVESDQLQNQPAVDSLVVSGDVIDASAEVLASALGDRGGRVGVLGWDVLAAGWMRAMEKRLQGSSITLEDADDLGFELRRRKSPAEQELLRRAGSLGSRAMSAALAAALPGATEAEVAAAFFETVVAGGGAVYDVVISSGPQSRTLGAAGGMAAAARWTTRRLERGDLLRLDAYGSLAGYMFDFARSLVIGGEASEEQEGLISALRGAVAAGVDAIRPGVRVGEVAARCEEALAASAHARRFGVPDSLMDEFWGHGLGVGWEPPWIGVGSEDIVEAGMCLAIERRATVVGIGGAQHEDNLLVTEAGHQLLSLA